MTAISTNTQEAQTLDSRAEADVSIPSARVRGILKRSAIGITAGSLALGTIGRVIQRDFDRESAQIYGTVANPQFAPEESVVSALYPYTSYSQEALLYRDYLLAQLFSTNESDSERKVESQATDPSVASQNSSSPHPPIELPTEYTTESATELARQLVERLLQKSLPEQMKLKVGFTGTMGGFANSWSHTATASYSYVFGAADLDFYETVGTLAHEVGHLVYRGSEEQFGSLTPWRGASYSTTVREEAVATLFRLMVAHQIEEPGVRFIVGRSLEPLIEAHLRGEKDYGFIEGAALCDAALTLSGGDFAQAWNMLAGPEPLDPTLYEVIERNRALYQEVCTLEQQVSDRASTP